MKNQITTCIILLLLLSCGIQKQFAIVPETIELIKPELNKISESEIGESLVERETGSRFDALEIVETIRWKSQSASRPVEIEPGTIFIHTRQTNKYDTYTQENNRYGISIDRITNVAELALDVNSIGRYNLVNKQISNIQFKKIKVPVTKSNYLKQEFIYNGKIGTGVKFTYREFSDNLARAAFTQDLQYELNEGNVVGFKGLRIEIIKAQNTKIEYKVLSYFK
jgi:hypothetical protein